jgi:uncharacterized membrane protein
MIDSYPRTLTFVATIGAGLVAGVLFAFSTFVMKALRDLPGTQGLSAMQSINRAAPNPLFMIVLLGTALLSLFLGVRSLNRLGEPAARYQLAGSISYLAGIVLTIAYHIPHNDALARVKPSASGAIAAWHRYATSWTAWNHVRTVTSLVASVAFALAFRAA